MSADPDCLFCKIVAGDLPADLVYRGDRVAAFRDIKPAAPVHILVVPIDHHRDVVQLAARDEPLLTELVTVAGEIAKAEADGEFRMVFNTGAGAGQTVFHVHAHILAGELSGLPG